MPSLLHVNLASIDHNLRVVRRIIGDECEIGAVVKADAYGLGATRVGRRLETAGASLLAVFSDDQACELLTATTTVPVLVLMPIRVIPQRGDLNQAIGQGRLHLTVHDREQLESLDRQVQVTGRPLPIHLSVDTGLSRGGCRPDEAVGILERIAASPLLSLAGIFTHFASAGSDPQLTRQQFGLFEQLLKTSRRLIPPDCRVHAANTMATLTDRRFHRSMVRVGLGWAGYGVDLMRHQPRFDDAMQLRPTVTWSTHVVHTKTVPAGAGVGYGLTWRAERESFIGVLPVGYADGYPISLGTPAVGDDPAQVAVLISTPEGVVRRHVPVVGAVSMDQLTVDLTAVEAPLRRHIGVSTAVELITPDPAAPNHLPRIAKQAGSLPHAILCGLGNQVRRMYDSDPPMIEVKAPMPASKRSSQLPLRHARYSGGT